MKRVFRIAGYVLFGVVMFVFFLYLTFPWDRVKDFALREINYPVRGSRRVAGQYLVEAETLSPSWFTGVSLSNVRVRQRSVTQDVALHEVVIPEASARVSLLDLLTGSQGGSFDVDVGGGRVRGSISQSATHLDLDIEFDSVQLKRVGVLRSYTKGLPIAGRLSGIIDVHFDEAAAETAGTVDLTIKKMRIADGKTPLKLPMMGELTLDRMEAGTLRLAMDIVGGNGRIKKLQTDGADVELKGTGEVAFKWPLRASAPNLLVRTKIKEAYRKKSDKAAAILMLLEGNPIAKRAMTEDKALQYRLVGSLGHITPRPAGRESM